MNQDPYQVLGISRNASDEEVKSAYRALARKYHPDNYSADNPLADLATEKMKEINEAYDTIQKMRSARSSGSNNGGNGRRQTAYESTSQGPYRERFNEIRRDINARRYSAAESKLSGIPEEGRTGEWHFLHSITLYARGWANDAMRELEIACSMEPDNMEFQQAKQMFNQSANGYGSTYYNEGRRSGGGCSDTDFCTSLCCANCLCNLCGGGCG